MQILRVQYFNSVNLTIVEVGSFYFFLKIIGAMTISQCI